jgi:NlpC/P60 family putative phage cell wall peptidase
MGKSDVVEEARRWIGTPFHHQGRVMGVGVDCAGLVACVASSCGYQSTDVKGYGRTPSKGLLQKTLASVTQKISINDVQPGDILLMRFKREPQHLAISTGKGIIHAYEAASQCVEHVMDDVWRKRIVAVYRMVK